MLRKILDIKELRKHDDICSLVRRPIDKLYSPFNVPLLVSADTFHLSHPDAEPVEGYWLSHLTQTLCLHSTESQFAQKRLSTADRSLRPCHAIRSKTRGIAIVPENVTKNMDGIQVVPSLCSAEQRWIGPLPLRLSHDGATIRA